jgi:cation transport ATPase
MNLFNRYQSSPLFTLLFFIGASASFAWGIFRVVHRHDRGGYFEAAICVIVFFYFNKNARRHPPPAKIGDES